MTFLNPFYLLGVVAGIIPFLIHLLHRRRLKVIDFSSIEFLKKIEGRRTRWFRVKEMLLLILRTLAVVLLALAISRPVLKSTLFGPLGTHARTSSVFILDNSYSMGARTKGGSSFVNAKVQAKEILNLLDRGDEASLVLASNISRPVFEGLIHEPSLVKSAISDANLSSRHTDFRPSLQMAVAMLDATKNLNKEVYLFTDMQRSGFESFSKGGIRGMSGKRLYIFDSTPGGQMSNLALNDLVLADPLLFEGGRIRPIVTLRNYSERGVDVSLHSRLDGREMGVKQVSLPANSTRAVELAFSVEKSGLHYLRVDASQDDLITDNSRFLSFKIPGKTKVALIVGRPLQKRGYVETALSPEEGLSVFAPELFGKGQLPSIKLEDYGVLALLDVSSLNSADVLRVVNFAQKGGGVFVTLGPRADVDFYNSVLLPKLGSVRLEKSDLPILRKDKAFFMRISDCDYTHPVFSQFRDREEGDMSIAHVYNRLVVTVGAGIIAWFSDRNPFIVESAVGKGKVIFSAIPLDGSYSDLQLRAIYVPLIHRVFRYLSMGEEVDYNVNVGERLSLPVSGLDHITCTPPGGKPVKMEPRIRSGRMYAEYSETELPGVYSMAAGDSNLAYFAVNPDAGESDVSKGSEEEIRSLLAELRPRFLKAGEKPELSIFSVRLGLELTNPLIILVLVILGAEMLIAGRWKGATEPEI